MHSRTDDYSRVDIQKGNILNRSILDPREWLFVIHTIMSLNTAIYTYTVLYIIRMNMHNNMQDECRCHNNRNHIIRYNLDEGSNVCCNGYIIYKTLVHHCGLLLTMVAMQQLPW